MGEDDWLLIGEVARRSGLSIRTLRHYDDLGLLTPSGRTPGDYRLYSPDDLRRLLHIQHLKSLGLRLPEIADALDDPDVDAAQTLRRHIDLLRDRLAAERELLARLTSLTDAAAAGWEDVLDVIALSERLRHPESWVRVRAALDAPRVAPLETLVEQLVADPDPGVREVLTWAAVQHGPPATPLITAHLDDEDPEVRLQMAHVLSKLADPEAVAPLIAVLDDPDAAVASKAAFALGQLGGPDALAALTGELGHADPARRDTVTYALGRFGPAAVAPVRDALAAPDAAVRAHAAEALGFLGDPAATAALAAALADPDAAVRFSALVALGQLEGEDALRAIRSAATGDEGHARLLAERLLADADRDGRARTGEPSGRGEGAKLSRRRRAAAR